jgi:hypothetical protein
MSYYQHNTEEIIAYFRIPNDQVQKDLQKSIELGKKHDGNIPKIFEEIISSEDLSPIARLLFAYSLGRSTKMIEMEVMFEKEMKEVIINSLQKGMELGTQLSQEYPDGSGRIELSQTDEGIKVNIVPDNPSEEKKPEVKKTNQSDPMYR